MAELVGPEANSALYSDPLELLVLSYANPWGSMADDLVRSCQKQGFVPTFIGLGTPYLGYLYRYKLLEANLRSLGDSAPRLIMFLDGYDTLVTAPISELVAKFKAIGGPWVFSAQPVGWFDRAYLDLYPRQEEAYKYLNSGAWIGETRHVLEQFERLDFSRYGNALSEEAIFTRAFVDGNLECTLDYKAELFHTMCGTDERLDLSSLPIRDRVTGSAPCVIHGNSGGQYAERLLRGVRNLLLESVAEPTPARDSV